jgi:hypothetical protein
MRNCVILGSGRSGTSLTAGLLAQSGYFMGTNLIPPDPGNPKGYFEDWNINRINEDLIAQVIPKKRSILKRIFNASSLSRIPYMQRWLLPLDSKILIPSSKHLNMQIALATHHAPYCYKDPRFCYTLNAWLPYLDNAIFICVFRHPFETAQSILKEAERTLTNNNLHLDFDFALNIWYSHYHYLFTHHYPNERPWLFVHYNQFMDGSVYTKMESLLEAKLNRQFFDASLKRSTSGPIYSQKIIDLYNTLCALANNSLD